MAGWKDVGGAKFFVAEPAAQAQAFEDFLQRCAIGKLGFDLFADFVAAVSASIVVEVADCELFWGRFKSEEGARGRFGLGSFFAGGGGFRSNAEQLAVFGESAVGGIEEEIHFVDAWG